MTHGRSILLGLLALAACAHERPPAPPPTTTALTIPSSAPPAPPPPPGPVNACAAPAVSNRPHLSVRGRYAVGERSRLTSRCDRLMAFSETAGYRLMDPTNGNLTPRLEADDHRYDVAFDEMLSTGAIGFWTDQWLFAVDRIDLRPRWSVARASRGRVFSVGDRFIEQSGYACHDDCAIVAHASATGAELWRRECGCDHERMPMGSHDLFDTMTQVDDKIIVVLPQAAGVEAWSASDGKTAWTRLHEHAEIVGKFVVLDVRATHEEALLLDANGKELRTLRATYPPELFAADGDTFYIASNDAGEYGGLTNTALQGFDVTTGKRVMNTTLKNVLRRYASTPPTMWAVPGGPLYFHEIDNGYIATIDRQTGQIISSLSVAGRSVTKTATGFATLDEKGMVEILEPSDVASPPSVKLRIEGKLTVDGKPRANVDIVVGTVVTKTKVDGRFSATLDVRGPFWVKAKQPTNQASAVRWEGADQLLEADGRSGPYEVNLEARTDYVE